jgi:hypothetical protein
MSYSINSNQARTIARSQLSIFSETNSIMQSVITDATSGAYQTTVSDGTDMTESTPTITVTGTVTNPTIAGPSTIIVNGTTISLGTSGLNLNNVISDINDAAVSGIVASKDSSNKLVLTYTSPAATTWELEIGAGTANADLGLSAATTTASNPESVTYWQVWQGSIEDRAKADEMRQVIDYFENLGYTIERQTNNNTNKTFKWVVNY